jgi:hypothetical protein
MKKMLNKRNLPKDLQKYCLSYLSEDEINYNNGERGCDWNILTCEYAALNGRA